MASSQSPTARSHGAAVLALRDGDQQPRQLQFIFSRRTSRATRILSVQICAAHVLHRCTTTVAAHHPQPGSHGCAIPVPSIALSPAANARVLKLETQRVAEPAEHEPLLLGTEHRHLPRPADAAAPPGRMEVRLSRLWQIKEVDVRAIGDVQAPGGHRGGHHHPARAVAQAGHRASSRVERQLLGEHVRHIAGLADDASQRGCDLVERPAAAHKDDGGGHVGRVAPEQHPQRGHALARDTHRHKVPQLRGHRLLWLCMDQHRLRVAPPLLHRLPLEVVALRERGADKDSLAVAAPRVAGGACAQDALDRGPRVDVGHACIYFVYNQDLERPRLEKTG
mmetsp:Transcript_21136/g.68420  ORF Transcript_21136/g.68420 Transcript_21136/m.68420 type:complete len:337 (-) Transcript_21136:612-1622(-)